VLKWGHVFHPWSLFSICAFLPLLGNCEGKTQKRQVAGENKNKWRQLSPHSPSTQITSTSLHTPPPPPLHLPLGPHDGVVVRDDRNVPFSDFKKKQSRDGTFLKKIFPKGGPPSSMVLLVFLESENLLKI